MVGDEPLELPDDLRVAPLRELALDALLDALEPQLVEPRDLGLCEPLVRDVRERRTAPEAQRGREGRRGGAVIAALCAARASARSVAARSASTSSGPTSST